MRYWDDLRVCDVVDLGPVEVTQREIVEFAERYDPQPFHIDPEAAQQSPFGGLIASGWHTTALWMGMFVRGFLNDLAGVGGAGVESLRFLAPVRPGDRLSSRVTIAELTPSSKGLPRGSITSDVEVMNQRGEIVLSMRTHGLVARRSEDIPG